MTSSFEPIPLSSAERIAKHSPLQGTQGLKAETVQVVHRINLINSWRIEPGSRVLEIGCGQGTCTTGLAEAVGPTGYVDAIDPGSLDYGAPFTLGQAQKHISEGEMGSRIRWFQGTLKEFLDKDTESQWDHAVISHCIWYFDNPAVLKEVLQLFNGRVKNLLVAEYAMQATEKAAWPHVLAAIARASFEAHNPGSEANIRCLMSPEGIKAHAETVGWKLECEEIIVPSKDLLDGRWEVGDVQSGDFVKQIRASDLNERVKPMLEASRDAVIRAVKQLDGEKPRTMDVWAAKFTTS